MTEFSLKPTSDFIELMKLLKVEDIAQTGGHAKILIEENEIKVNGVVETQKRKKLRKGDIVEYQDVKIKIV
ncbi:MAG: RNA-binding S4 domain-containing protein [Crocinitomicaceae bacterium]